MPIATAPAGVPEQPAIRLLGAPPPAKRGSSALVLAVQPLVINISLLSPPVLYPNVSLGGIIGVLLAPLALLVFLLPLVEPRAPSLPRLPLRGPNRLAFLLSRQVFPGG